MEKGYKTPVFNWDNMDFEVKNGAVVTAVNEEALKQVIIKAQQTARGIYLIYADTERPQLNHKYGSDAFHLLTQAELSEEVRISELKRAIREAILYDPWVVDVENVEIYKNLSHDKKVMYYADYSIKTVFDKYVEVKGVELNG